MGKGNGKWEAGNERPKTVPAQFFHGVNKGFVGFKKCAGIVFYVYGLPQIPRNTMSSTVKADFLKYS